jgi:hypothetical protein
MGGGNVVSDDTIEKGYAFRIAYTDAAAHSTFAIASYSGFGSGDHYAEPTTFTNQLTLSNGKLAVTASTTTRATLSIPHGTAPTSPVNGDVWTTTSGLFARINGTTEQYARLASPDFTGAVGIGVASSSTTFAIFGTGTTAKSSLRIPHGAAPTSPINGDMWTTSTGLFARINGTVQQFSHIASPTFTGTPAAPTAAVGTTTTQIATTAFVRTPSVQAVTSSATVTATAADDMVVVTAQAAGITFANPTGTWLQGQVLKIRLKDNGTARAIAWGANFRPMGVALPLTTTLSKTMYMHFIYNSTDTKFDLMGINEEF